MPTLLSQVTFVMQCYRFVKVTPIYAMKLTVIGNYV